MEEALTETAVEKQAAPPEKVIVHLGYPLWRKHTLVAVARARELQDQGHQVLVTHCSAAAGTCAVNLSGSPVACAICRSRVKKTAAENGLTLVPLETNYASADLTYSEKRDLAEGVHSAVISEFRQLPGDGIKTGVIRTVKRRYYANALGLLTAMKSLVSRERPDRIEVFNGRHACSRFCLMAARSASIPFNTMEITCKGRPILFEGHSAHDRVRIQERMKRLPLDLDLAARYFDRRRRPSVNKFAKKHSAGFQPPDASGFRKKISVFLSSQDEFEALGRDWKTPFPDYADVIREACQKYPDYLFCIRFHPNQASMASDIETPFRDICALPNAVVYFPLDTANSYTLVDWSDVVVTFGSTVTIEACWMGKPAIMLGPSFYDQLDVAYTPGSVDEFLQLLRQDLVPRPAQNAARLAVYQECDGNPMTYVGHDGRKMVPNGVRLERAWLSRIARTSDNVFCRLVKSYAKWAARRQKKAA
ncbi:MAG: hypothetical protein KDA81_21335 [Planctomycetaceae bacterium]|nr:hypothetical protein [Planctomycetaceae bacterium]